MAGRQCLRDYRMEVLRASFPIARRSDAAISPDPFNLLISKLYDFVQRDFLLRRVVYIWQHGGDGRNVGIAQLDRVELNFRADARGRLGLGFKEIYRDLRQILVSDKGCIGEALPCW